MVFTSFEFAVFFGVALVLNWRLKANAELYPPFLLLVNFIFYGLGAPRFLPLLVVVAAANWYTTVLLYREHRPKWRKLYISLDVVFCLGLLFFFKYFEFGLGLVEALGLGGELLSRFQLPEIVYPIGMSFFTFQGLSLAIDHYRDPTLDPPEFLAALNFVSFFPTVLSGPIQRAGNFIPQMYSVKYDPDNFNLAVVLILSGLFKKITLSSYVSEHIVRQVFQVPETFSAAAVWAGIYGYGAQIYLDFSGYSDLALGIGLLLGYNVGVNFDSPYLATNIREFWHRWHISLSTWLRDYLYFPLGGNRKGRNRTYFNLLIVFFLCGLWHGADFTFVLWGLWHGFFLVLERLGLKRLLERLPVFLARAYTIVVVISGWVFFRAVNSEQAFNYLAVMFSPESGGLLSLAGYFSKAGLGIIAGALLCLMPDGLWPSPESSKPGALPLYALLVQAALFFPALIMLIGGSRNPFIYFNF